MQVWTAAWASCGRAVDSLWTDARQRGTPPGKSGSPPSGKQDFDDSGRQQLPGVRARALPGGARAPTTGVMRKVGRFARAALVLAGACACGASPRPAAPASTVARAGARISTAGEAVAPPTIDDLGPAGTWRPGAPLVEPRVRHTAVALADGRVLVVGGFGTRSGRPLATTELHDPATHAWRPAGRLARPRVGHAATMLPDGRVLVTGPLPDAEVYDPAVGAWWPAGRLRARRDGHVAVALDRRRVLIAGGRAGSPDELLRTAEVLDLDSGLATEAPWLRAARYQAVALRLADGRALVTAGSAAGAELYDPARAGWSRTWRAPHVLSCFAALVPLADGRVMAVGSTLGDWRSVAALYDPARDRWHTLPPPPVRMASHAVGLPDGRVFVVGLGGAALYDPATARWRDAGDPGVLGPTVALADGRVLVTGGTEGETVIWSPW